MGKSKIHGEQHVKKVFEALVQLLEGIDINHFPKSIIETVNYIVNLYPNIKTVQMKYEFTNADFESDLKLSLTNDELIHINLFTLEGLGKIQPKNPGANSFLETYFQLPDIQKQFNEFKDEEYKKFLIQAISTKEKVALYDSISQLRRRVNELYPKFNEKINPLRRTFLFNLREFLFELLNSQMKKLESTIAQAFDKLLLVNEVNIITRNIKKENVIVEQWQPKIQYDQPIELYRKGNDTIGIRKGQHALTLRIKFESAPSKSLKLATSYDLFPEETTIQSTNLKSLAKFKKAMAIQYAEPDRADANAIGKCNEALVYSTIIEHFPMIYQVDETEYIKMYEKYAPVVKEKTRDYLIQSAPTIVAALEKYFSNKYQEYSYDSIQLVPDSYIKDKLDTTDIKITLKVDGKLIDESFSLKAVSKRGSKITIKNPGVGTILSPLYFDCGSTEQVVEVTKSAFLAGQFTHLEAFANVSRHISEQLLKAPQQSLQKGLQAMVGSITTIITFYEQLQSEYYERKEIKGDIQVFPSTPTPINTKLVWNDGKEYITIRVKFSGGQHKGWTSLKLDVGYVVN